MKILSSISFTTFFLGIAKASAQTKYSGPGLSGGVDIAQNAGVGGGADLKTTIADIAVAVVKFMALASTVVIIIAGIMLIVGTGSEQSKERAKKTVIYTIVGLLFILLAGALISFVRSVIGI